MGKVRQFALWLLVVAVVTALPCRAGAPDARAEQLFKMTDKLEAALPWELEEVVNITGARGIDPDGVTSRNSLPYPKGSVLRQMYFHVNPLEGGSNWITSVHLPLSKWAPTIKVSDVVARYGKPTKIEPLWKHTPKFVADSGYSSELTYTYKHKSCLLQFHFDDDREKKLREIAVLRQY